MLNLESLEDRRVLSVFHVPTTCCNTSEGSGDSTESNGTSSYNSGTSSSQIGPGESTEFRGHVVSHAIDLPGSLPTGYDRLAVRLGLNTTAGIPLSPGAPGTANSYTALKYYDINGLNTEQTIHVAEVIDTSGITDNASGLYGYQFEYGFADSAGQLYSSNFAAADHNNQGSLFNDMFPVEDRTNSPYGDGWWLDDYEYLVAGGQQDWDLYVFWSQGNSGSTGFAFHGGNYHSVYGLPADLHGRDGQDPDFDYFELEEHNGTIKRFDPIETIGSAQPDRRFLLSSMVDPNGNVTSFSYDDANNDGFKDELVAKIDIYGRTTLYTYYPTGDPSFGFLKSKTDYTGRVSTFEYNGLGQLTDVYAPEVLDHFGNLVRPHTQYGYTDGLLTSVTNPNGHTRTNTYGAWGRYESATDFEGNVYTYGAQMAKPLVDPQTNSAALPATSVLPSDFKVTEQDYRGYSLTKTLDRLSLTTKLTDANGSVFEYDRDDFGRITEYRQAVETAIGQHVSTTEYTYTDIAPFTHEYVIDDVIHDGDTPTNPIQEHYTYNAFRDVKTYVDELGRKVVNHFDNSGQGPNVEVNVVVMGVEDVSPGQRLGDDLVTTYDYTDLPVNPLGYQDLPGGLVTHFTDPEGRTTTYHYHSTPIDTKGTLDPIDDTNLEFGYLERITLPDVGTQNAQFEYSYQIDSTGTIVTETETRTDSASSELMIRQWKYHYDALGRLTKVEQPDPDPLSSALVTKVIYKYDDNNNVRELTDAEGRTTLYEYNKNDLLSKLTEADPNPSDPNYSSPTTEYFYDAASNLVAVIDPLGRITSYQYDPANRLVATIEPDVDGVIEELHANPANQYDVNADGNVDWLDYDLVFNATAFAALEPSGLPKYYFDADRDGAFEGGAGGEDTLAVQAGIAGASGTPAYESDRTPVTLYAYDPAGNITSITDAEGNETEYRYDNRGRLASSIQPSVEVAAGVFSQPETTYIYDKANQLVGTTDPLLRTTNWQYDDAGRLVAEALPNVDGSVTEWQNAFDPFDVDGDGAMALEDQLAISDEINNRVYTHSDGTFRNPYQAGDPQLDVNGDNLVSIADINVWDAYELNRDVSDELLDDRPLNRYSYDRAGNLTFLIDPMFNVTEYQYDDRDRMTYEIHENPLQRSVPFQSVGDPLTVTASRPVTQYAYDITDRLSGKTNPIGFVTTYEYDDFDRITKEVLPDPNGVSGDNDQPIFEYTYDLVNNLLTEKDGEQNVTTFSYDGLHRLTQVQQADVVILSNPGTPAVHTATPTIDFEYDVASQLTSITDPLGRVMEYRYDRLGRTTHEIMPDPVTGLSNFQGGSPYYLYTYDLVGNVRTEQDAEGVLGDYLTERGYDALYRVISQTDRRDDGALPLVESTTAYLYDAVGNRTSLTDPEGNTTQWEYDGVDRVKRDTNQLTEERSYQYDLVGNLISKADRRDWVTAYSFDNLYRNTGETWYDEYGVLRHQFTFGYDLHDRMTLSHDGGTSYDYTYTYDNLDRLDSHTIDITGLHTHVGDVGFGFDYDRMNNRALATTTIDGVNDYQNSYGYDSLYRLRSITQRSNGGNAVADKHVDLAYDVVGQMDFVRRYAGTDTLGTAIALTDFGYDQTGRLDKIEHFEGGSVAPLDLINGYDFTFDAASRITAMQVLSPLYFEESVDLYEYNYRDELEIVDYSIDFYDENYTYDLNGNRDQSSTSTGDYSHTTTANNQLQNDGVYTYAYDAEGNRSTRTHDTTGGLTEYSWDHRNRLTSVTERGDGTNIDKLVTYTYDAYNQMISRTVDELGTITERFFVYDDSQIVMQFDGDSSAVTLSHRYLWSQHIDQQLADEQVESTSAVGRVVWALTDHQGSVRDLVEYDDATTNTVTLKHRRYDAFGNVLYEKNRGDFNGNGIYDAEDIDQLFGLISAGLYDGFFDLNGDSIVDSADVDTLVLDIINTVMGDANLDGVANGQDFIIWHNNRFTNGDGWDTADFNGDGMVDSADFLIWNTNKFTGDGNPVTHVLQYIFGFTGRLYDDASGLQNNLNRWYDAQSGRWLSEDPISFLAGDSNLYRYVGNSVPNFTDPYGLQRGKGGTGSFWGDYFHFLMNPNDMDNDLENYNDCAWGALGAAAGGGVGTAVGAGIVAVGGGTTAAGVGGWFSGGLVGGAIGQWGGGDTGAGIGGLGGAGLGGWGGMGGGGGGGGGPCFEPTPQPNNPYAPPGAPLGPP